MQSYMEAISYFLQNNQIFLYISGLSTIFFLLSLVGLSWLISIIPHDYFVDKKRVSLIKMKNPLMWLLIMIIKNSIGLILVLCGILMKIFIRNKEKTLLKFFPLFSEISIALIIGIIFSINIDSFSNLSWNILVAVALHNLIGLFLGFLIASFFKFPMDVKKTVAIEVAMQNSGLGMTLALMHFTKLVALPSALFSLWHNISASGLVYFWKKK